MGKHSEKKKNKNVKFKLIFLVIIILCTICGMIKGFKNLNIKSKEPQKAVEQFCIELKRINKNEVNKYVEYEKLLSSLDEMLLTNNSPKVEEIEKLLFKEIEWNIKQAEIKEESATVTIELTNIDFKNIMIELMKKIVTQKAIQKEISTDIALEKLYEVLNESNNNKVTTTQDITLYKEKNNWRIEINENLVNLIYPGISDVVTALN